MPHQGLVVGVVVVLVAGVIAFLTDVALVTPGALHGRDRLHGGVGRRSLRQLIRRRADMVDNA